jgi:hypothetical protein
MKHMLFMKEVTSMKTYMTIAVLVIVTLAFGLAYANEFPIAVKDEAGREVYLGTFPIHDSAMDKDFSVIGEREIEPNAEAGVAFVDIGTVLYNDLVMNTADSDASGSAAGGMATEDANSRIWDDLLKPTGLTE